MVLRWLLVAIGITLAVVLMVGGYVIIGALIAAAAVLRAAILLRWRRRGHDYRHRYRDWSDPG